MNTILPASTSRFWIYVEYSLLVYMATFPFITYDSFLFGGTSARAANLIVLTIVIGIALTVWLMRKSVVINVPRSPILLIIGLYALWLVVSSLTGINIGNSFWSTVSRTTGLWYFLHLALFLFLLVRIIAHPDIHRRLTLTIIISTALYSLLSLISPEGLGVLFFGYKADAFTFGNSSFAGMYLFGVFILSLYYLFQAKKKKWWMYIMPIILIVNPTILNVALLWGDTSLGISGEARLSSYAVALSLVGIFVIWLVSKIKDVKKKTIVAYSLFGFGIMCATWATFSLLSNGIIRQVYLAQSTAARPLVWELSEQAIAERPIFGWGTENLERVFELNYDNRLLEERYGSEAWFDRAHNIFIDQLVDVGIIGAILYVALYLVTIGCLIHVSILATERKDRIFASLLIVYFSLHFVELQTAFDTTISYPLLMFMIASAIILFQRTRAQKGMVTVYTLSKPFTYITSVICLVFFVWSLGWGWWPFVHAQISNGAIRTIGNSERRMELYSTLFSSPVDAHVFLWRTSIDLKTGITRNPGLVDNPEVANGLKQELIVIAKEYERFLEENPTHFRGRLNLADVLIFVRLFGVDRLEQAQQVLDEAIELVPQSPQPYWMKAVAYVYMRKFDLAREYAKKAQDLNPNITESDAVADYVEKSIKTFPNLDLYNFKQI